MDPLFDNPPIKNWFKKVVFASRKNNTQHKTKDVFGVPLIDSLQLASTFIAYENKETIIGSIPIVVAKCGSFLKDQGLYVEGIFRKSGSAKRLGELQHQFNNSADYGMGQSWRGYTVHDAANCLRRFLNYLPEPIIIFSLYDSFRDVAISATITTPISNDDVYHKKIILEYQRLIDQLPIVNQYLLYYLLDLLALFNRYANYTKMNSMALAAVFTPGILLLPDHALNPSQYKLSQLVIQFLIENQHHFHLPKYHSSSQQQQLKLSQLQPHHIQHLLRANTVPVKKKRFGPNDPLQIISK